MPYVVLDTETTGIGEEDRICQLCYGILDISDNSFDIYDTFCKPPIDISYEAMATHHITSEMVQDAQKLDDTDVYKKLFTYNNEDNILVIHNCKFDLDMLSKEGFEANMQIIDTLRCMQHLYPDSPSKSLQYLRYSLGLYKNENDSKQPIVAHNAIGDVIVLKLLLDFLLENNDKDKLIELTKTPILYKKFPFGKYKNESVEEIVLNDLDYCLYLINNNVDNPDLAYSLKYFMEKCKDQAVYRFRFGKYKGKSIDEINDLEYLKWAYKNMSSMGDGLKQDIAKKLGNSDGLF